MQMRQCAAIPAEKDLSDPQPDNDGDNVRRLESPGQGRSQIGEHSKLE